MGRDLQLRLGLYAGLALWAAMAWLAPLQAQRLDETGQVRQFERLSLEESLSHPNVLSILQDHQGYLWFATYYGLNRYDGGAITTFYNDPLDDASLAESSISEILEDHQGALWIATWGGGLDRFDALTETFIHHRADPSNPDRLQDDRVQSLFEDRDGTLWVGTFAGGLARLDRTRGAFETFRHVPGNPSSLSHDRIWDIAQDPDGRLWVATGEGLCLFDPATGTTEAFFHDAAEPTSLPSNLVRTVHVDRDGALWVGTERGLHRFDRPTRTFEPVSAASDSAEEHRHELPVNALFEDRTGALWVGTGDGLDRYDRRRGTFEHFVNDPRDPLSLSADFIGSIAADRADNLWIGTRGGGVSRLDLKPAKFRHVGHRYDDPDSLSEGWVFAFAQDSADRLWIATLNGLDRYDEETGEFVHFRHDPDDPRSLPNDYVRDVAIDHEGRLWVTARRQGLSRLVSDQEGFVHFRHDPDDPTSLINDTVESLYCDRSGTLWVGTRSGLDRFDPQGARFEHFRHDPDDEHSLNDDYVQELYEDRQGFLWVGTDRGGLHRFDRESRSFERFQSNPADPTSLSSNRIHTVCEDRSGGLWVGTSNGLNALQPDGTFRRYFEQDGLPSNRISGIVTDEEGYLWISTFGGLTRLDPAHSSFRTYTANDGLHAQPFIRGATFQSPRGHIYFGGENGFDVFAPQTLFDNPNIPPIVLTSIRLFGRPMVFDAALSQLQTLELPWRENVLTFEFAALDFTHPQDNRYRFKLEGFDPRWSDASAQRQARYTGLDPGDYVFRVQGSNNDGVWNEEGASVKLAILPPPWKTWWAYTLYVLTTLAVVLLSLHWQQRRVERERAISHRLRAVDKLRDEFLANTSHELKTPLYGMTGLAESLLDGARGVLPPAVRSDLAMIVASGRRLGALVGDILDLSKLKNRKLTLDRRPLDLRSLVEVVLTLSRPLVGSKSLALENIVAPDLPAAVADENRLQQILHNLVGNAIRFTESGSVEISATVEGERLVVCVADTGVGVAVEEQHRIFDAFEQADAAIDREHGGTGLGLAVTRQLVELHGGQIWVESSLGKGARFFFSLPAASEEADTAPIPLTQVPVFPSATESPPSEPANGDAQRVDARIMIVDDEPVNRQVLKQHLASQGLRATTVPSGEEALRMLEEQSFDLVLLDVMMPKMSGYEVCRALRERRRLEELPVIFLTAKNQAADAIGGLSLGANDYLTKPISKDELLARIRPHLELVRVYRDLHQLVEEKVSQIKVLRGYLPICAVCKKIRDDDGAWSELEAFIDEHSEAQFSHGFCPDCAESYAR